MFYLAIFLMVASRVLGQGDTLQLRASKAVTSTGSDQGMLINIGALLLKRAFVVTSKQAEFDVGPEESFCGSKNAVHKYTNLAISSVHLR